MQRTFIAVQFKATEELRHLLQDLRELGSPVRPTKPENLHVTLKFLGDTEKRLVPRVTEILHASAVGKESCEVLLHGLGAFPSVNRPSVVWVGLQFAELLEDLAKRLDQNLVPLGFPLQQEPLLPHLTVGRIKAKPPRELATYLKQHSGTDYGTSWIRSLEFYQSELRPDGAHYASLASVPLCGDIR